jgi:hypothetical protein
VLSGSFKRLNPRATRRQIVRLTADRREDSWTDAQTDARALIEAIANGEIYDGRPITYQPLVGGANSTERFTIQWFSSPRDRIIDGLVRVISNSHSDLLRKCSALLPRQKAACGRVFVRVTQKQFCSEECRSRTYMRGYMKTMRNSTHSKSIRSTDLARSSKG